MYASDLAHQIGSTIKTSGTLPWRKLFLRPVRFVLSGGLATGSHWLVMAILISAGIAPLAATATGAIIGAMVNYVLQRNVTFESNTTHSAALPRYIGVCTLTWIANLVIFLILYHLALLSPMYAQGVTSIVVSLISYFLYRRIVFNDHQPQPV